MTFNLPATTSTYPAAAGGPAPLGTPGGSLSSPLGATPESPFSPEIQTILDDRGVGAGVGVGVGGVFRSHSVPVQDMLGATGKWPGHQIFCSMWAAYRTTLFSMATVLLRFSAKPTRVDMLFSKGPEAFSSNTVVSCMTLVFLFPVLDT